MKQILSLNLNEEVFDAIRRRAEASGLSPAEVAAESLHREFAVSRPPVLSEAEREAMFQRMKRHIGAVAQGTGCDNEQIDADLARSYGDNHEVE